MVAGAGLHGAGAIRVACGQGLGHRRRGLGAGVPGPAQGELQRGALREGLERRQPLWGGEGKIRGSFSLGERRPGIGK